MAPGTEAGVGSVFTPMKQSSGCEHERSGADSRHSTRSRISTTMDIYAQLVPESQRRALAKDVSDGRGPNVKADCTGEHRQYCHSAAIADGELASGKSFWSQLEPNRVGRWS